MQIMVWLWCMYMVSIKIKNKALYEMCIHVYYAQMTRIFTKYRLYNYLKYKILICLILNSMNCLLVPIKYFAVKAVAELLLRILNVYKYHS